MTKPSWYRSWFESPYYHILYRNRDEREAARFIDNLLKYFHPAPDARILDLACGKGRHSINMAAKGYRVTGVDLSKGNIASAKTNADGDVHFEVHDMREPVADGTFDFVFNLFTSFGYFESEDQNEKVLHAAAHNLKWKGKLLLDFMNVSLVADNLVKAEKLELDGITFEIDRHITDHTVVKSITVIDGDERFSFEEKVKAFKKPDLSAMLTRSGFEILDIFGNYSLENFDESTSPRLIFIARKIK